MENAVRPRLRYVSLVVLLLSVVLLSGCLGRERVMVPPKVDLDGAERVAVLYFDNFTDNSAVTYDIEERVAEKLREYYHVVDRSEMEAALSRLGLRRGIVPTRDEIVRLGRMLDVDAFVTGEVSYYFDDIIQTPPTIKETYEEADGVKATWVVNQRTMVLVSFTGRVLSAKNGSILYSKKADGEASETSEDVIWSWTKLDEIPPWILIPSPSRLPVRNVQSRSVRYATDQFVADLLPTYVWKKIEE